MLKCEIDSPAMEKRILRCARHHFGARTRLQADFEHGQWWITVPGTGAQYSVNDCEGSDSFSTFDFEEVTPPDED